MSAGKKEKEAKAKAALQLQNNKAAKKQGWLTKLGGKGLKKNWQRRWFVLDEVNLYYFTDDSASKVKGYIPLAEYTNCESITKEENTFKLFHKSQPDTRIFMIKATSTQEMNEWIKTINGALEKHNNVLLKYGPGVFRTERSLFVKIAEARKLGGEKDTYCTIYADDVQRARTPTVYNSDVPMYLQEYDMDLDKGTSVVTVFLKEQKKKDKKESYISSVALKMSDLADQKPLEQWFPMIGPDNQKSPAEIRLTAQYQETTVLPDLSYDELFHLLLVDHMHLTKMLAAVSIKKEKAVADCLVKAFEMRKTAVHFVKEITASEITSTPDPNIIFRGNTVGTKSVDIYMRLVGLPYLHRVLKPVIDDIYKNKKSCEVDTARLEKGNAEKTAKKNLQTLIAYVKQIFEAIRTSFLWCPASFRNIFEHIQQKVMEKFPTDPVIRYTAPSGFIFLRFFCPALLGPKLFGLVAEHPPAEIARDLTLIAKTLQNLANLVPFGRKEPYMNDVNKFIEDNMPPMKEFIDKLCSPPTEPIDEIPSKASINFGREMARINSHLISSFDSLKEKFGENEAKLVKLLELFQKMDKELQDIPNRANTPLPIATFATSMSGGGASGAAMPTTPGHGGLTTSGAGSGANPAPAAGGGYPVVIPQTNSNPSLQVPVANPTPAYTAQTTTNPQAAYMPPPSSFPPGGNAGGYPPPPSTNGPPGGYPPPPNSTAPAIADPAVNDGGDQNSDASLAGHQFVLDPATGYLLDQATNIYYDTVTGYPVDPATGQYITFDQPQQTGQ